MSVDAKEVVAKLAEVRAALEHDRAALIAVEKERDELRTELATLRSAPTALAAGGASNASAEEVANLRRENERLQYRILHLCRALDELNKKAGVAALPPNAEQQ